MSDLFTTLKENLHQMERRKIVFPEAIDERVLRAASRLHEEGLVTPILIGDKTEIEEVASKSNLSLGDMIIYNPATYQGQADLLKSFMVYRKGKVTEAEAKELLQDVNYFGTMLVQEGLADGLVSGAIHSTSDTVRPALQIIKTKEGIRRTSGAFIMVRGDEKYVFADCAINISPTSEDLAEIAVTSAETARLLGVDPKVAMLSFSTNGSAKSPETDKVVTAVKLAKQENPLLTIDGEFQFDAAFVPAVAKQKAPNAVMQGDANVFVFPSLESGNIGYKIAERLGGLEAIGPILQGLNKPVNDLSRGCDEEDVYKLALITAGQV